MYNLRRERAKSNSKKIIDQIKGEKRSGMPANMLAAARHPRWIPEQVVSAAEAAIPAIRAAGHNQLDIIDYTKPETFMLPDDYRAVLMIRCKTCGEANEYMLRSEWTLRDDGTLRHGPTVPPDNWLEVTRCKVLP